MEKLSLILENPLAVDLGLTLFHAFWQGLVLLGIYFLGNRLLTRASQKVNLGLGVLLVQLLISVGTFLYFHESKSPLLIESGDVSTAFSMTWLDRIHLVSPWLFGGWLLGFSFLVLKNVLGYGYVQWLKRTPSVAISPKLSEAWLRLESIVEELGKNVELKQSLKAQSAMVIGTLSPVILFPAAWVAQLSPQQLELILAHELAHVKRNDFLINTFQIFVESLFFFHPVYWFIGNEIKHNRELACDEQVVAWTGKDVLLAQTLAQIQVSQGVSEFAMAFGKKRMTTLNRIEKLLGYEKRNTKSKLIAVFLMSFAVSALALEPMNEKDEVVKTPVQETIVPLESITPELLTNQPPSIKTDTVKPNRTTTKTIGSNEIRIKTDKSNIEFDASGIRINGKEMEMSAAEKRQFKENWEGLKKSQKEIEKVASKMSVKAQEIAKVHTRMASEMNFNPSDDPDFQEYIEQVSKYGSEIGAIGAKMGVEMSTVDKNDPDYKKKIESIASKYEPQMKEKEALMKELEPKMKAWEKRMSEKGKRIEKELEEPIKKMERSLKVHEDEIEEAAEKMEIYQEQLFEMLPQKIREEMESAENFNFEYPTPPTSPIPPISPITPPTVNIPNPPTPPSPPLKD